MLCGAPRHHRHHQQEQHHKRSAASSCPPCSVSMAASDGDVVVVARRRGTRGSSLKAMRRVPTCWKEVAVVVAALAACACLETCLAAAVAEPAVQGPVQEAVQEAALEAAPEAVQAVPEDDLFGPRPYARISSGGTYCGSRLSEALRFMCDGQYNTYFKTKKIAGPEEYWAPPVPLPFRERLRAAAFLESRTRTRYTRGVFDECCVKACTVDELMSYCRGG